MHAPQQNAMQAPQQNVMVQVSVEEAAATLAKIGNLGSHISFHVQSTTIRQENKSVFQGELTIEGDLAMVASDGQTIATLAYETAHKGHHLRASLVLATGEAIFTFEAGSPPPTGQGVVNRAANCYDLSPLPPIASCLQGQPYGTFSVAGHSEVGIDCIGVCRFTYADGSQCVSLAEKKIPTSCCGICGEHPDSVPDVPLQVGLVDHSAGHGTTIHLFEGEKEVRCKFGGGLGDREKLGVVLMGASLAAKLVTRRPKNSPHHGGAAAGHGGQF